MAENFFGNAPNHAMPYDSVTYNGGTVPTSAGYHLVKRGSYGSVTFGTDKCVVDFDGGCTFTNILISGDQVVLNFGPKTALSADNDNGTLGITGDRNYVYFGPQSTIFDTGVPNARGASGINGNGMGISIRGKFNTVEGANWTVRSQGPHSGMASYKNDGTAIHNTFKNMLGRVQAGSGSYIATAIMHASAPHTTFYNCLADNAAPAGGDTETNGGYLRAGISLGPISSDSAESNTNGNGYGSRIQYCYLDISGNSPFGSSTDLPTGSSANNNFGIINNGAEHSHVIGTYLDGDGNTASLGMHEPNTLIYGCIWDSPSNLQQETTGTCVASIFKDPDNSNGTQTNNIAVGGSMIALTND